MAKCGNDGSLSLWKFVTGSGKCSVPAVCRIKETREHLRLLVGALSLLYIVAGKGLFTGVYSVRIRANGFKLAE